MESGPGLNTRLRNVRKVVGREMDENIRTWLNKAVIWTAHFHEFLMGRSLGGLVKPSNLRRLAE